MQGMTFSVTQLNDYVRRSLAGDPIVHNVWLRGEISNYKAYTSGHWYFTLKDENSCIDCVLFRQYALAVPFAPRDGMRVLLFGSAGLYIQGGKYQFYAENMRVDGVGELYQRYLQLKEKLEKEGLFDPALKRPLPLCPRGVGIVTSLTGAVQHDIRTVAGRRFPGLPLFLRPARVQGEGAARDIVNGITDLQRLPKVDVIIVGRGGGSLEDLWAFNEEEVARAVRACRVPVISAVGHETDYTLCDFAADVRAATPSAAAELAVPVRTELLAAVDGRTARMAVCIRQTLMQRRSDVLRQEKRIAARHPGEVLRETDRRAQQAVRRMRVAAGAVLSAHVLQLEQVEKRLRSAGPGNVLRRGYAIVRREGRVIRSAAAARGKLELMFADGCVPVMAPDAGKGENA